MSRNDYDAKEYHAGPSNENGLIRRVFPPPPPFFIFFIFNKVAFHAAEKVSA